jgi:4-hydroxy-tetrahydrodipicolinate reductase
VETITVAVHGALGKMGREVMAAVSADAALKLIGGVDIKADADSVTVGSSKIPLYNTIKALIDKSKPQVIVDFSLAEPSMGAIRTASKAGINMVVGTTGFSAKDTAEINQLAKEHGVGIILSPNFALGAVILMHLSKVAARYFDNVEIIELHHDQKADAPSGTALATAKAMIDARQGKPFNYPETKKENLAGSRGGQMQGVAVHSVRLPGFVASQEVVFGIQGQTLKIRHDAINRECYMPGVILSVKEVSKQKGTVHSLEDLLKLGGK